MRKLGRKLAFCWKRLVQQELENLLTRVPNALQRYFGNAMHAVAARTEVPKISWHVISKGALVNRLKKFHNFYGPSHPSHANEIQEEFFGLVPYLGTGEKPFSCSDTVTIQKQQDWATYGNSENIENVSKMT